MFSRQTITFGKIQKQIKCEMMNSQISDSALEQASADNITQDSPHVEVLGLSSRDDQSQDSETNDSSLDEWENGSFVEDYDDPADELHMAERKDISENLDSITVPELSHSDDHFEQMIEFESIGDSLPSNIDRIRALENKLLAKGKEENVPGRNLPVKAKGRKNPKKKPAGKEKEVKVPKFGVAGSAKRLKLVIFLERPLK